MWERVTDEEEEWETKKREEKREIDEVEECETDEEEEKRQMKIVEERQIKIEERETYEEGRKRDRWRGKKKSWCLFA